jgi:uncharacterized protein involved in response to NO
MTPPNRKDGVLEYRSIGAMGKGLISIFITPTLHHSGGDIFRK